MTVAYPLDAHSIGFVENAERFMTLVRETNRLPPSIHLLATNG
jgi:hypothetical protein